MMQKESEKVLSYYDVLLRVRDVKLLENPYAWLNDQILDFYFEYLSRKHFPQPSEAAFLGTSVVFLLANSSPTELEILLQPLDLPAKTIVFLPVNNNSEISQPGGSHWSLLVYFGGGFCHYDSVLGCNSGKAKHVAKQLATMMGTAVTFTFEDVEGAPQQTNGSDCGLFVLAAVEKLCEAHLTGNWGKQNRCFAIKEVTPEHVCSLRKKLLHIVQDLRSN